MILYLGPKLDRLKASLFEGYNNKSQVTCLKEAISTIAYDVKVREAQA